VTQLRKVGIVGIGITKFGKHLEKGSRELFYEAAFKAIEDASIDPKDIEALYFGNAVGSVLEHQAHMGPLMAEGLGLRYIPAIRFENACASSGVALRDAYFAISSGFYDTVLVGGAEKMVVEKGTLEVTDALALGADNLFEYNAGLTFPGLYATIARAHMKKYGTTEEQLAMVSVKNHKNAMDNPNAHFHKEITIEDALNARPIAEPLKLFDCCPISDGAAAVIMVSEKYFNKFETPIEIIGSGQGSDSISLQGRKDITRIVSAEIAARTAYKMAGVTPEDIDLAEVHDCFTIAEIIATEGLGFFKIGEGGKGVEEGETQKDGRIPINVSGGLKAKGHPVGATGVAQVVELVEQLRGEAGKRQVSGAEIGLAHNVGGSGATATVHILRR